MKRFFLTLLLPLSLFGQDQDLAQRIAAFQTDMQESFKVKTLNIGGESLGALEKESPDFRTDFKLEGLEKQKDNLDRNVKYDVYVHVFQFADVEELNWVMKRWLPNFMDGASIRPGRDKKTIDHVDPTVVVIDGATISVLTLPCPQFSVESFRDWRSKMLTYFGSPTSVIIEVAGCEGPLMWTKNPPDSKDRTWR
jgi:hypothetical protein